MKEPERDGQVTQFAASFGARAYPRLYYVNGIQTSGAVYAKTAMLLSELTENVVTGIYNKTAGIGVVGGVADFLQCVKDWGEIVDSKVKEIAFDSLENMLTSTKNALRRIVNLPDGDPVNLAQAIREKIPLPVRTTYIDMQLASYNLATLSLFRQLRAHQGDKQHIVAHSQGNLIVSNALWAMVLAYGDQSLSNVRVYSLASPSPAWPQGLHYKRKVYGHKDDLVTLADPHNWAMVKTILGKRFGRSEGDWRVHGKTGIFDIQPHDVRKNMALNFFLRIRQELGLPPIPDLPPDPNIPFE